MPGEDQLWESVARKTPEQIEAAFRDFFSTPRADGVFMPKPQEILALIKERTEREARDRQYDEVDAAMHSNREARESGMTVPYMELQKLLADTCKRVGELKRMPAAIAPEQEIVITAEKRDIVRQQIETVRKMYGKEQRP